jgi:hypothetical protein
MSVRFLLPLVIASLASIDPLLRCIARSLAGSCGLIRLRSVSRSCPLLPTDAEPPSVIHGIRTTMKEHGRNNAIQRQQVGVGVVGVWQFDLR